MTRGTLQDQCISLIAMSLPLAIWLLMSAGNVHGQEIHFSQHYASPLNLNPALTGNYYGDWRFMHIYRHQWDRVGVPFISAGIGYDRQFYVKTEKLSAGFQYDYDRSGDGNLRVNKILISGAYHKTVNYHDLHFGIQLGLASITYNRDNFTFDEQWDHEFGIFNPNLPHSVGGFSEQGEYTLVNVGMGWDKVFGRYHPQIGLAFNNIHRPKLSFAGQTTTIPILSNVHVTVKIELQKRFFLMPRVRFAEQSKAQNLVIGTHLGKYLAQNKLGFSSVNAGIHYRSGFNRNHDAVIAIIGTRWKQLDAGISYDINISTLKVASNYRGGFEISLIYTGLSTALDRITIPCERE